MFDVIFDMATITLLGVTIAYAYKLNRKLNMLQSQKGEMASNLQTFSEATETAVIAVEELHVKGEDMAKIIDEKIRKAQLLADEIEFLTIRAEKKIAEIKHTRPGEGGKPSTLNEAQILKALRERDFKAALAG